jgi:tetraacyldisaccharide 4'-kinase
MINKIKNIIYSDDKTNKFFSAELILFILSKIYSFIIDFRIFLYEKNLLKSYRSKAYVISVGNITAGGTGKTPFTAYLCRLLANKGFSLTVVMRGYKGEFEKTGGIVINKGKISASSQQAGDEAYLTASKLENIPVMCGRNKVESVKKAETEFNPDIIILDDGFSHLKLKRDLDIVLLDYKKPFGNSFVIPRGILREKKENIKRADALVYTRADSEKNNKNYIFYSLHKSFPEKIINEKKEKIPDKFIFLFSGIGNNMSFYSGAIKDGYNIKDYLFFEDHHQYSDKDIKLIMNKAKLSGCTTLMTTLKDYCRIEQIDIDTSFELIVMDAEIEFYSNKFDEFLMKRLNIN